MKHPTRPCLRHAAVLLILFLLFQKANGQVQTPRYANTAVNSHGYYEYLPPGYGNTSQSFPLLVFIHGIGELGDGSQYQLQKVLANGPPKLINNGNWPSSFNVNGKAFNFIVISPQFTYWPGGNDIKDVIDYCISHYRVDQSRIYVTGLSMGGGVTWDYASMNTDAAKRIAAIVPVCGASDGNLTKGKIIAGAGLAVWGLQNKYDPMVSSQNTVDWYNAINAPTAPYANPQMRMTIFPVSGHDAWDQAYDPNYRENGLNVYEWMLQYSRNNGSNNTVEKTYVTAKAGNNITITLPQNQVQLDGSGSSQGNQTTISWSKVAGPDSYSFNNISSVTPIVSNLVSGTYTFRITVTNNSTENKTATDEVTVKVAPAATAVVTYTNIPGTVEAENYNGMSGVQTEATTDLNGGEDVGYIDNGDWMDYGLNVTKEGNYQFTFRTAAPGNNAQFLMKRSDGSVIATVHVPQTWGFQSWQDVATTVYLPKGKQTIRIQSTGAAWNFNRMTIATAITPPPPVSSGGNNNPLHIEAENWINSKGVVNEATTDVGGGQDVGYIDPGDWMEYKVDIPATGNYTMNFRVASPAYHGQFQVRSSDGSLLRNVSVPNTGGYQVWQTISTTVYLSKGTQTIRIVSIAPRWNPWNINWLEFTPNSNTAATASNSLHIEAENYTSMSGVHTQPTADFGGGLDVDYIDPWDWMMYSLTIPQSGYYTINFRVASPNPHAQLTLLTGNSAVLAQVDLPNTGSFQTWQTVSTRVYLSQGQQVLKVLSSSHPWNSWNFNWMDILPSGTAGTRTSVSNLTDHTISVDARQGLTIYPNPVHDVATVLINNSFTGQATIQVLTASGGMVNQMKFEKQVTGSVQTTLPMGSLPPGTYLVNVTMPGWTQTIKVIKN